MMAHVLDLKRFDLEAQALVERARDQAREILRAALSEAEQIKELALKEREAIGQDVERVRQEAHNEKQRIQNELAGESQRILEEARQEAQREAQEIQKGAHEEVVRIQEEARQTGFAEGAREGRQQAYEEEKRRVVGETGGLVLALQAAAQAIEADRQRLSEAAKQDLVGLAVAIAEKIIKIVTDADRHVSFANLKRAVELTVHRQELEVLVSPKDYSAVEEYLPVVKQQFLDIAQIRLQSDPSLSPGGAVVRGRQGVVDLDVKTQLREIERQLRGTSESVIVDSEEEDRLA